LLALRQQYNLFAEAAVSVTATSDHTILRICSIDDGGRADPRPCSSGIGQPSPDNNSRSELCARGDQGVSHTFSRKIFFPGVIGAV
jgi:hypothetical protein